MTAPLPQPDPQPASGPASRAAPVPPPVRVKVVENGPLQVKGPIELLDADGNAYDVAGRRVVILCRCGRSSTKPFCDGGHARTGFSAPERTGGPDPEPGPTQDRA